jgi:uncharacterized iron-regulated protein
MKKNRLIVLAFLLFPVKIFFAQDIPAYTVFTGDGKKTSYSKMLKTVSNSSVILFGELHDNSIAHWLQLVLAQDLTEMYGEKLAFGSEMFETHQAKFLSQYLIDGNVKSFTDSTKLWSNFTTDYKPVVDFARENKMTYFAANVPRKYASLVFKKGPFALDSLNPSEKALLCPLPFPFDSTLSQYKELIKMGLEMHASGINFAQAQAIKDATMAWNICEYLKSYSTILHFNGSYHSDFHQGIEWYIHQYNSTVSVATISTVTQSQLKDLDEEYFGKADFIIVVDERMTKTMQ